MFRIEISLNHCVFIVVQVAFLEPALSKFNPRSVAGSGFAERSLEAQEVTARLEQSVASLDGLITQVERYCMIILCALPRDFFVHFFGESKRPLAGNLS